MPDETLKSQTRFLESLNDDLEWDRKKLIKDMRYLAARLVEEANRLEEDPLRFPSSNGYVACLSTSEDIDNGSVRIAALMSVRHKFINTQLPKDLVESVRESLSPAKASP